MARTSDDITLGELLQAARLNLDVSMDEASAATRVSVRVIEAFENDDYDAMPPRGYAQNMLAAYARYLGISPNRAADLYATGFEAAAQGYRPHGADEYRRGRPIDVSQAGIVDPHYGRKRGSRGQRPSISREGPGSQGAVQQRGAGREGIRRGARQEASNRPSVRSHGSLERPGIDDASAPDRVSSAARWRQGARPQRETDARRSSAREGRRQVRETRQGQSRANGAQGARQRQQRSGQRPSSSRQQRPSAQQGFGRGVGVMRDREDARRRREDSLVERVKAYAPFIFVALIVVIAVALFASANHGGAERSTVSVQTASTAVSGDSTTTSDAAKVTTQTGTTRIVTGNQGAVRYEVAVELGHTCDATVTIDGTDAYSGTLVGPATQSFTASRNVSFEFSSIEGVTLSRDGEAVAISEGESGTGSFAESISQGR